ncbi:peptide chain release factor N(5)-glutamine methyltransferase [Flavobacterium aciduliphilum]|uniref:Release factor glutamine methyltransferase n=1 Tax=Flavobacterium aciduliphilum TaxID=1101402 RepID=A0A328YQ70_9FLAO|nr:peptide chain release factor N(5)-glutamine methyltransferase [Flavobacterium aciduliphilum]RAR75780.1 release factor glutamine methyltransferase [Flavobacterium aciduliphilum]
MLLKTYKSIILQKLSTFYEEKEIESFFYILLEHFHNTKRIDLALNPSMEMNSEELKRWENAVSELQKQKPIQYIIGETSFYGLPFLVNENTLIPRPETEELVDWIVFECRKSKNERLKILDVGTGSGCIAISLAKNIPNADVFTIDVSEKAMEIARKNALMNKVTVDFICVDVLKLSTFDFPFSTFDIIVSNPPYVRVLEKAEMKPNVLEYEPHTALFVSDDDALIFYRKIAQLAQKHLSENGTLFFEINQYLGKETVDVLDTMGFKNIELKKDLYSNDRMVRCIR